MENIVDELLLSEGITREDLELVDLEICYSPVIPIKGGHPVEVIKLKDDMYRLDGFSALGLNISKESLTVMRYRYLTRY